MSARSTKAIRWIRHVQVSAEADTASCPGGPAPILTASERLLLALTDGAMTVAQLAHQFGLAQPTVLEQVRRALREGLITEVQVPEAERRFPGERYYAPAVPVIRQPDREILETACRAVADAMADVLLQQQAEILGAVVLTSLYREGWQLRDLWPYLQETIYRLALEQVPGFVEPLIPAPHRPAWLEDIPTDRPRSASRMEDSA